MRANLVFPMAAIINSGKALEKIARIPRVDEVYCTTTNLGSQQAKTANNNLAKLTKLHSDPTSWGGRKSCSSAGATGHT